MEKRIDMKPDITLIFPRSKFLLDEAVFPPLGILYLSAFLKRHGITTQCLDMGLGHVKEMAEADTVGISFCTPQRFEAWKLVEYYKSIGKRVIVGGPHVTHMPDEAGSGGADYIVRGYGEEQLANILSGREVSSCGIDNYPYPDRSALPLRDYRYMIDGIPATVVMTSRGCPFDCSFCGRVSKKLAMQSAERTIEEILHIHHIYEFEAFMIFDDIFILGRQRLRDIAEALEGKFKFRCFGRADLINDETCELMCKMGVVEVGIGIESGSDEVLKLSMKKSSSAMNFNAVKMLQRYGIRAKAFIIVGLPGESAATIQETARWIKEVEPDDIDFSVFQPMPGSNIFKDPQGYGINFQYDTLPYWFKGIPGEYSTGVSTEDLSGVEIVAYRDLLEERFKRVDLLR